MLEMLLAYHCGPALAGIKTANLVSCSKRDHPMLEQELNELNRQLNHRDIYFLILCECAGRMLVMVYRKQKLQQYLQKQEVKTLLQQFGYPDENLKEMIAHLRSRMEAASGFPHEIGLFLGYPIHDVTGFLHKRQAKYTGHWKVYEQVEEAKKRFRRYDVCRAAILRQLQQGKNLTTLFGAV